MKTVSEFLSSISSTDQKVDSTENVRGISTDYMGALIDIEDVSLDVHQGTCTVAETASDVAVFVYENNEEIGHLQDL